MKMEGSETDRGGGVSPQRLTKDPYLIGHRSQGCKMKLDVSCLLFSYDDPYILRRNKALDPPDGLKKKRLLSHQWEHLLWIGLST